MDDCDSLLEYWLGTGDDDTAIAQKSALWWQADAAHDREIGERFGALRNDAIAGRLQDWAGTPRGRLALILLIDQFSRNLFRDDARAFAHDALARAWCCDGLDAGFDANLRAVERVFFYLPLEHSEALPDQQRSVALFEHLLAEVPPAQCQPFANFLDFAKRHRDIIARFGRFPHRNAALGRVSTPAEREFLKQPESSFQSQPKNR